MTENSAQSSTPQPRRSGARRPASADQERLVRRYLSVLETNKAGRGVKRAADAIGNRITKVDELLVSADPLTRVHLTQERIELHAEYVRITNGNHPDVSQLERDFVRVVRSYGDRYGITYAAWRQVGVEATVLEQAGIHKADKKPPPAALRAAAERAAADENGPEDAGGSSVPGPAPTDAVAEVESARGESDEATPPGPTKGPGAGQNGSAGGKAEVATTVPAPPGEVSLDELADLLSEAGSARTPPREASEQPSLGNFEAASTEAVPDRPRPSPRG